MFKILSYGLATLIISLNIFAMEREKNDASLNPIEVNKGDYRKKKKKNSTPPSIAKEFPALVTDGPNSITVHPGTKDLTSNNGSPSLGSLVEAFREESYAQKASCGTSIKVSEEQQENRDDPKLTKGGVPIEEQTLPQSLSTLNEDNPPKKYKSRNKSKKETDLSGVSRVLSTNLTESVKKDVNDKGVLKSDLMSLEKFKGNYDKQAKMYDCSRINNAKFKIPPSRHHKKCIGKIFKENPSTYKKHLIYAALQFVINYGPDAIVLRLFNYPQWNEAECDTYLELGDTEKDSFFLVRGYFGNKKPKQYLLLALNGEFTLIENETEKSTRFGCIDDSKIDQLKISQKEMPKNGVPVWLAAFIPAYLSETYCKSRLGKYK